MKIIITVCLLLLILNVKATNYYFSSVTGLDTRTAIQAQNQNTPWQTTTRLNSFFTSLQPGDSVLFKRGETFYGFIRVSKSGLINNPIVISAYGIGAKPIITGMQTLTGWVSIGGGVYQTTNTNLRTTLNMLTIDTTSYAMGRFPNANAANGGYNTFEQHLGNTQITDNQLTTPPNWTGAQLVVRVVRYVLSKTNITNQIGGNLIYSPTLFATPTNNFGYFIQNDIRTLDQFGEWYFNPSSKTVSMFFGAANPTSFTVKAAAIDTIFTNRDFDNINVVGLSIQGGNQNGFDIYSADLGISRVLNCDVRYIGQNAMFISISNGLIVSGNTVQDCGYQGIYLSGGTGYTITNNVLKRIAILNGMAGPVNTNTAIRASSNNTLIRGNVVDSVGYVGIRYIGNNDTIKNNFVQHHCMILDDAGGIYSANSANGVPGGNNSGNLIVSNIVINGGAAIQGTNSTTGATSGIYLDDNTNGARVDSNSVANVNQMGFFLHNTYNISGRFNTFFNATANQLYMIHNSGQMYIRNMSLKRNIYVSSAATQYVSQLRTDTTDILLFGVIDSNWAARPIDDNLTYRSVVPVAGVATGTDRNLAQWQTYSGYDLHTPKFTRTITNVNQLSFLYNETNVAKVFPLSGNYVDIKNVAYSVSTTLQPWTSLVLINTGALITPVITWNNPAPITYGTALSTTQLNAVANVPGSFMYVPAAGTILNAGTYTLNANFTPTDPSTYSTATKSVTLVVNPAPATLTYSNLTQTYTGTPLAPTVTTNPAGLTVVNTTYNGVVTVPTNAGSYAVISGLTNSNYTAPTISATFVINKAVATMTLSNLAQVYDGTPKPVTVTTNPGGLSGVSITYNGSATVPTNAGTYSIVATLTNANYTASNVLGTLFISKATPTVSWSNPAAITYPTALSGTQLNATASVAGTFTYTPASGTILNAGTQTLSVDFTPTDATNYNSVLNTTVTIVVNKGTATLSLSNLAQVYDGTGKQVTVTTSPVGLSGVSVTYDGSATLPINAGSYAVIASLTNSNYTATPVSGTLVISKATATLSLSNLNQNYTGSPLSITVTTAPVGLGVVSVTYNGSATVPTNAGSYPVIASLTNANYTASNASGTFVINKVTPTITWSNPANITYGTALSGTQLNATASTVGIFTYTPPSGTILNAGTFVLSVNFVPTDGTNYNTVNNTTVSITVNKATATITLSNLVQDYDGNPKPVTVTTSPVGLNTITTTYNGSGTAPTNPGSYTVVSTLTNMNYTATPANGTLVINTQSAAINITNINQTYTGSPLPVTVTTNPAGLPYDIFYSDIPAAPTNAGTYAVVATINDGIHTGRDSATYIIAKANPAITWATPTAITYGTALSGTQLNASSPVAGVFTYTPASGTVLNAGIQNLSVSFVPTDNANYNNGSANVNLTVNKATATITLSNLNQAYDGTPKSAIATTNPVGLNVITITYNGSPTAPSAIGSYAVNASLVNADYTATPATGTLVISTTAAGVSISNINQVYTGSPLPVTVTTNPSGLTYSVTYNASATVPINVGSYTVIATLNDGIHTGADTQTLVIRKATPIITWGSIASITYPTALSSTQLNATSNVPGTFTYLPISGTVLNGGTQSLQATFTPTDASNYNSVNVINTIVVNKASATLGIGNLNQVYDGTAKPVIVSSTPALLDGIDVTYNGSSSAPTNAGNYNVIATLTNDNYTASPVSAVLVIRKGYAVLSWAIPDPVVVGTILSDIQLNATSNIAGTFSYIPAAGTVLNNAGGRMLLANFTPADPTNYNSGSISVPLSIFGYPFLGYWIEEHGGTYFENLPNQVPSPP